MKISPIAGLNVVLLVFLLYMSLPFINPELPFIHANDLPSHIMRSHFAATGQFMWSDQSSNGYPALTYFAPLGFFLVAAVSYLIGLPLALNFVIISCVFVQAFMVYLILHRLKGMRTDKSLFVSLLWVANPFFLHFYYNIGRFGEMVSLTFCTVFMYFFMKHRQTGKAGDAIYSAFFLSLVPLSHYAPFTVVSGLLAFYFIADTVKRDYMKSMHTVLILVAQALLSFFWLLPTYFYLGYAHGLLGYFTMPFFGVGMIAACITSLAGLLLLVAVSKAKTFGTDMADVAYIAFLISINVLMIAGFSMVNSSRLSYTMSLFALLLLALNSKHILEAGGKSGKCIIILMIVLVSMTAGAPIFEQTNKYVAVQTFPTGDNADIEKILASMSPNERFIVFGTPDMNSITLSTGVVKYGLKSVNGPSAITQPPYLWELDYMNLSNIDRLCQLYGISYIITNEPGAIGHFRTTGYEERAVSGSIHLFRTPYGIHGADVEAISYSPKANHFRTLSGGWHTVRISYFPAWTARNGDGNDIPLQSDNGYMSFFAGPGEDVYLEYNLTPVHYAGIIVSILALICMVSVLVRKGGTAPLTAASGRVGRRFLRKRPVTVKRPRKKAIGD